MPAVWLGNAGGKVVKAGRSVCSDVILPVPMVSKQHACLVTHNVGGVEPMLLIVDTSANGVWVNGNRLPKDRASQLQDADFLEFLPPGTPGAPVFKVEAYSEAAQFALPAKKKKRKRAADDSTRSRKAGRHALAQIDSPTYLSFPPAELAH